MRSIGQVILVQNDPILAGIIRLLPEPEVESANDVFHDLMSCIMEQQIHYRSTNGIFAKALQRASIDHLTTDNFHLLQKHALSQMRLAMGKYETMLRFVEYWSNNAKDFNTLSDQEVVHELSSIKGIGQWTMDMILLFTLKRPNVLPYDDFHLKQVMVALYGLDEHVRLKAQMLKVAENWGQHRSLAVQCLWAWKQHKKRL